MYVCICNAITDADVRTAEEQGAVTETQVFAYYGAEPQCGSCVCFMRDMMGSCAGCPNAVKSELSESPERPGPDQTA
jgi:bacterioferritin-associated ferredoxin